MKETEDMENSPLDQSEIEDLGESEFEDYGRGIEESNDIKREEIESEDLSDFIQPKPERGLSLLFKELSHQPPKTDIPVEAEAASFPVPGKSICTVPEDEALSDSCETPSAVYKKCEWNIDESTSLSLYCPPVDFSYEGKWYDCLINDNTSPNIKPRPLVTPEHYTGLLHNSVVCNTELRFLQGSLLEFAVLLVNTNYTDEQTHADWVDKHSGWSLTADAVVQPDTLSSTTNAKEVRTTRTLSGQLCDCHSSPAVSQGQTLEVSVMTNIVKLKSLQSTAILHIVKLPLTIRQQHLDRPMILEIVLALKQSSPLADRSMGDTHDDLDRPFSCWNAIHGKSVSSTCELREALGAPTSSLLSIPWSSAVTGGYSIDMEEAMAAASHSRTAKESLSEAVQPNAEPFKPEQDLPEVSAEIRTEMLRHAISSCVSHLDFNHSQNDVQKIVLGTPIYVTQGLSINTKLVGAMMHLEIENTADKVGIEIEDIHVRGIGSHCHGDTTVKLNPSEQQGILLHLDEQDVPAALKRRLQTEDIGSAKKQLNGCSGNEDKTVENSSLLSVIVRWRILGSSGPSIWSLFSSTYEVSPSLPLDITIACPPRCSIGTALTVAITITNLEGEAIDLVALLPKDLQYHRPTTSLVPVVESPPVVPLSARKEFGKMLSGASRVVYMQFLAVRQGMHILPPIMLLERIQNRRFLLRGGHIIVT